MSEVATDPVEMASAKRGRGRLRALVGNAWVRRQETAVIAALGQESWGERGRTQQVKTAAGPGQRVDRAHRQE